MSAELCLLILILIMLILYLPKNMAQMMSPKRFQVATNPGLDDNKSGVYQPSLPELLHPY